MISFRNFALRRGERLLLSKVDIALHAGWRVGVVGRNGCGKTSLFAAILGEIEADSGDLEKSPKLRIASVAQETPSLPDAAIDFVVSGDTEVHAVLMAEEAAIAAGVTLNLESEGECERSLAIGERLGRTPRLAVRVNPDFDLK